ncbi:hypothetical protein A2397_02330 [Candidatus Amesbacteria bacterium RIFOXYB1_FULL_44_23]|uniref:GlcNAc-PI de-N-acetylase n=1 Tax=Candidatus Amesbacteria bacterium RIFOXYB1_FULL_44_23 TaxID=1797263 RepID=A0A1F4ZSZ0_9BACT|nr:MAG: hypothetical protein A2397_02330 [Candidatus Amesbacteria bacterium RIFOXYB1_FULL_44_23]
MTDLIDYLRNFKGNKTLMTVFPHPDDESMATGGLLVMAKSLGWRTIVVSITAGGAGQIHTHAKGRPLVVIRKAELKKAGEVLGIDELEIGDFDDGKMKTERGWQKWLELVMAKHQPGLVVTYDPSGFYGHPDHIALSCALLKAYQAVKNGYKLMFVAVPEERRDKIKLRGMDQVRENMVESTHRLDFGWRWFVKWRAARMHKSQGLGKSLPIPLWLFMALNHCENYHLVEKTRKYVYKYIDYEII